MVCFMSWLGKPLTDVFTTTLTPCKRRESQEGFPFKDQQGADVGRPVPCPASAPQYGRLRMAGSHSSPPPSSSGFSNLKPAAFPAQAGARAAGEGGAARQPTQSHSPRGPPEGCGCAPRARAAQAHACQDPRDCLSQEWGSSQRPVSRLLDPAEGSSPVRRAESQVRLGGKRRAGRGWAGRTRFPGAEKGRVLGGSAGGGSGPVLVALCQLY